jgi:hypothetical protein
MIGNNGPQNDGPPVLAGQRHRGDARQQSPFNRRAGIQRDGLIGHDGPLENGGRSKSGRCADLPEYIGGLRAAAQNNPAAGCRCKSGSHLHDEHRIRVPLRVEGEIARRYFKGSTGFIESGRQRQSAEITRKNHHIG